MSQPLIPCPRRQRAFSLVEMAVVLAIIGLVAGIALRATGTYLAIEKRRTTETRLAAIDAALVNYVAQNRRLPCPANGALASGAVGAGVEQRNAATGDCTSMNTGVVPWISLGLAESDILDGWNVRITYRVPTGTNIGMTRDNALNMSSCDPAGTGPRFTIGTIDTCQNAEAGKCELSRLDKCTSPTNYLANRGLQIQDGSGGVLMDPAAGNGAAYVLISHGENGAGGYNDAGILLPGSGVPPSARETRNANNATLQPFYIDAPFVEGTGATHFDDILSRPSVMTVITKAQLGPRARTS